MIYSREIFNEREFNDEVINKVDWNNVCKLNQKNPNSAFKIFYDTLNFHLDEHAPYRKVTKKELELLQKPWITQEILFKCKHRDTFLKSIAKETDEIVLTNLCSEYKNLTNQWTLTIF